MTFKNPSMILAGTLAMILVVGITAPAYAGMNDICLPGSVSSADDDCIPCPVDHVSAEGLCVICVESDEKDWINPCEDDDNDGVLNFADQCPDTPPETMVDAEGCSIEKPVAGELLSINSSALVLGGLSSMIWMMPVATGIAAAGIYLVKSRINRD